MCLASAVEPAREQSFDDPEPFGPETSEPNVEPSPSYTCRAQLGEATMSKSSIAMICARSASLSEST